MCDDDDVIDNIHWMNEWICIFCYWRDHTYGLDMIDRATGSSRVARRRAVYRRLWVKFPKLCTGKMESVTPPVVMVAHKGEPTLGILPSYRTMCSGLDEFSRQAEQVPCATTYPMEHDDAVAKSLIWTKKPRDPSFFLPLVYEHKVPESLIWTKKPRDRERDKSIRALEGKGYGVPVAQMGYETHPFFHMISMAEKQTDSNKDRFSELSTDLIGSILERMSARDAARTSILSKKWRYIGASLPQLKLDKQFLLGITPNQSQFVRIIDKIVLLHHGPIQKFILYIPFSQSPDMDFWILILLRNGVVLKYLQNFSLKDINLISLGFNDFDQVACALCLLRSSPSLKILKIDASTGADEAGEKVVNYMEAQGLEMGLNQLQTVRLGSFSGLKAEVLFAKLLLSQSPSLKRMEIENRSGIDAKEGLRISTELMRFPRASNKAEIVYLP
ncbi:hypothetical protein LguiB_018174 [Lonicera macranthoides]